LKKVSAPFVAAIEAYHVSGQKSPHDRADGCLSGSEQQMEMIWNNRPGIAGRLCFQQDAAESFDKIVPVLIIFEYPPPFYPSANNVMQRSGSVYS